MFFLKLWYTEGNTAHKPNFLAEMGKICQK